MEHVGSYYLSPGYSNEIIHLYIAKDLIKTTQNLDPFENLEVIELSLDEAFNQDYKDIKTAFLVNHLKTKNLF